MKDLVTFVMNALRISRDKRKVILSRSDDDESEGEPDGETEKHVTTLTRRCESDEDSFDEDVSYEELADSYKEFVLEVKRYVK